MATVIKGPSLYQPNEILANASVTFEADKILAINADTTADEVIEFPSNYHLIPGMIDVHIHGANKADTMDATFEALQTICTALPQEGTTAFLATTMSQSIENTEAAITNTHNFMQTDYTGAEIIGLHLEGPFLSKQFAGAQPKEFIIDPDIELFEKWIKLSGNSIKQMTIAPERPGAIALIKHIKKHNIIPSLGHSDADYDQAINAIEAGCNHATHTFNAMRSIHHRNPNAITALLNDERVKTEIIVDGVHLHPAIVELTLKTKSKDNVILITDAMRAKCCCDGEYTLGGQDIIVKNHEARLKDGTLAGSVLKMGEALKNTMEFTGCSLQDIVVMASVNPAKQLNIYDTKGSIEVGKDADLVVLDNNYKVVATFCRGKLAYQHA